MARETDGRGMLPTADSRTVLWVSDTSNEEDGVRETLKHTVYNNVITAKSAAEARRILLEEVCDLLLVNSPLPDEFGDELANYGSEHGIVTIILAGHEMYDELCNKVEPYGVMTVAKPLSKPLFHQALRLAAAIQIKLGQLEKEKRRLQTKIDEVNTISRAKFILMEYLRMSEDQAHKYIERQAMDMRETKLRIAENILKTYES